MFYHKHKFSPRIMLVVSVPLILVASLIAVYPKTGSWRGSANGASRSTEPISPLQQSTQIITSFFTGSGLPIHIQNAVAANDRGTTGIRYGIANIGGAEINGIDLALFDFNSTGGLMTVHAWSLTSKLAPGQSANFSLQLKLPATATSRLILTAEAVRGNADFGSNTATHWQANFIDLAQAIGVLVAGGSVPGLQITQRSAAIPELSGSSYCSDAFAKAFHLSKTSDGIPLNAFSCDRNSRSLVFGFNAKKLALP